MGNFRVGTENSDKFQRRHLEFYSIVDQKNIILCVNDVHALIVLRGSCVRLIVFLFIIALEHLRRDLQSTSLRKCDDNFHTHFLEFHVESFISCWVILLILTERNVFVLRGAFFALIICLTSNKPSWRAL